VCNTSNPKQNYVHAPVALIAPHTPHPSIYEPTALTIVLLSTVTHDRKKTHKDYSFASTGHNYAKPVTKLGTPYLTTVKLQVELDGVIWEIPRGIE